MDRTTLLKQLHRDQYDEAQCSSPGGRVLVGDGRAFDLGYRRGWNDMCRALIAQLRQGDVEAGLVELRAYEEGEGI